MEHRRLTHEQYTLAAIDDIIARGKRRYWAELRTAALADRAVLEIVLRVCEMAASAARPGVTLSTFRDVPWNAPFYARHAFRVLADDELTPGLVNLRQREHSLGLRTDLRVIMRNP